MPKRRSNNKSVEYEMFVRLITEENFPNTLLSNAKKIKMKNSKDIGYKRENTQL